MEVENISSSTITSCEREGDDEEVPLPGFRFHPTEEELVGFYLRRKVEKRPLSIELIKQIDIYKYDPWDLPKSSNVGEKEWYFFCQRGRKYRNSVRPNRVTCSGFWKATGIDRPIYSSGGEGRDCIGLKKSLVYYRGSAGKGTKTDWMMHEFRLPAPHDKSTKHFDATPVLAQEAEIWTLCRIFKRSVTYKKCMPNWRLEAAAKRDSDSKTSSSSITSSSQHSYISFSNSSPLLNINQTHKKPLTALNIHQAPGHHFRSSSPLAALPAAMHSSSFSGSMCGDISEFLRRGADWEDLQFVANCGGGSAATATLTANVESNYSNMFYL